MAEILTITADNAYAEFQRFLAAQLDQVRAFTPPSYEINLVLIHKTDPSAHMLLGQSAPLAVRQAIDETLADKGNFAMTGSASEGFQIVDESKTQ